MKTSVLLIFLLSLPLVAEKARIKKLSREDKLLLLIKKEEETINSVKRLNARLHYRKFELQNEKIKLISKRENEKFIKAKASSKSGFFDDTKKHYFILKKLAYDLLKFRGHKEYLAATFHSLALNCRDYSFEDKELYYINKALEAAPPASEIRYNILVSKAEYLYNGKNYAEAYELYKRIVKNDEDQWYTKNLYNYAWTQFKNRKFDEGIASLEKSYILSKNKRYVDFREQVINSLIIFYITHKKIAKAIKFIQKHEDQPTESLFKLARKASAKGFYRETQEVIKLLYDKISKLKKSKLKKGEKDLYAEKMVELKVFELGHYKLFNKRISFYKTVRSLHPFQVEQPFKEEAVNYITEEVGHLQQLLKKSFDQKEQAYNKKVLKLAIYYFDRLRLYDAGNKEKYFFYSAETLYSVNEFKKSIGYYKNAISKEDAFKLNKKSIDALYLAIEEGKKNKKEYFANLEYVYNKVIELYPSKPDTKQVIVKLFNLYLVQKDHAKMDTTIVTYKKLFPKEIVEQRGLYEKQLDLLIEQKDITLLSQKLDNMKKGFLSFSSKRTGEVEDILSTILFNKFKALRKAGKNMAALKGYQSVYVKPGLTKKIKAQAALNIAIIGTDLYKSDASLKWIDRTYKMDPEIYEKNIDIIVNLADRTLLFHDFIGATNLYRYHLARFCKDHKRNDPVMQKLISANLANAYTSKSLYYFEKYRDCTSASTYSDIKKDIIAYLLDENDVAKVLDYLKTSSFSDKERYAIIENLYWKNPNNPVIYDVMKVYERSYASSFFTAKNKLAQLQEKAPALQKYDITFKPEMSPEQFNEALNAYFTSVSSFLEDSKFIVDLKNKYFTSDTLKLTYQTLEEVRDKVNAIRSPLKDEEFNKAFYEQMKELVSGFNQQAVEYKEAYYKFRNEYKLLSQNIDLPVTSRAPSAIKTIDMEAK